MVDLLFILGAVYLFYGKTIFNGLCVDDVNLYNKYTAIDKRINFKDRFYGGFTFVWNRKVNLKLEHCFRVFLFSVACVLIHLAFGRNNISFCAALLYAFNPVNSQIALWLNARRYLINIIIVLLMMILGPIGLVLYPLTGFLQVGALFSFILIWPWGPLAASVLALFAGRHILISFKNRFNRIPNNAKKQYTLKRSIVIVKCYGYYFFEMVFPRQRLFYDRLLYFWGITDEGNRDAYSFNFDFFKGLVAILLTMALYIEFPGLYLIYMVLCMLQWSNFVTATMTVADRYMSMPAVFMMYFLSTLLHKYFGYYAFHIIIGLTVYYACVMRSAFPMFEDMYSFWRYHLWYDPRGVSARSFAINEYILQKNYIKAFDLVTEGLNYRPNDFKFLTQAAVCYSHFRNYEESINCINKAKTRIYHGQEENLGRLLKQLEDNVQEAIRVNDKAKKV